MKIVTSMVKHWYYRHQQQPQKTSISINVYSDFVGSAWQKVKKRQPQTLWYAHIKNQDHII